MVYGANSAACSTVSLSLHPSNEHLPAAFDHSNFIDLFEIATRPPVHGEGIPV
jgi:hypothetical protein